MSPEESECYRCHTEDASLVPVDINTGRSMACMGCFREGRRLGVFEL